MADLESEREPELWEYSDSPQEDWGSAEGADEDGKWPVDGIVGEEVDASSEKIRYEVRWQNWSRPDGSDTTWMADSDSSSLPPNTVKTWKAMQRKIRKNAARESLDIEIQPFAKTFQFHHVADIEISQAYSEKLARMNQQNSPSLREQMEALLAEKMAPKGASRIRLSTRARRSSLARSASIASIASTTTRSTGSYALQTQVSSSSRSQRSISPASPRNVRAKRPPSFSSATGSHVPRPTASSSKSRRVDSPHSTPDVRVTYLLPRKGRPRKSAVMAQPSRSEVLLKKWNQVAEEAGAAHISFVNDIDEDDVPSLPHNFRYLENGYISDKDYLPDAGYFVTCECTVCEVASRCGCQADSQILGEDKQKEFAYTPEGLFAFNVPLGVEVVECNNQCKCDMSCINRVAQRPRKFPIEIFKTAERGWGVRAAVAIETGKVLGIYTGQLIQRDAAEEMSVDQRSYCFDLDGREGADDDPDKMYSVDSRNCGNWTRFINHSCDPNLCVYTVVFDTVVDMNIPYIAFVALQDIPAGTEFTFDYDPHAAVTQTKKKGKGKGKIKVPEGATPCMCETTLCRGWVRA